MEGNLNAQLESYFFGNERGVMIFYMVFALQGEHQGTMLQLGPYQLEEFKDNRYRAEKNSMLFLRKILDVFGVIELERIEGKFARIEVKANKIEKIQHIVKDDIFIRPRELLTS